MIEIQRTKRFGLQKLKKIAGRKNAAWGVSPHLVLSENHILTAQKIKGAPRLLTRTDEKGKIYREYNYPFMPRADIHMEKTVGNSRRSIEDATTAVHSLRLAHGNIPRSVLIVHPTRNREDIRWTGRIRLESTKQKTSKGTTIIPAQKIKISIAENSPTTTTHRHLFSGTTFEYDLQTKKLSATRHGLMYPEVEALLKSNPHVQIIAKRIAAFVQKGIKSRQINPRRPFTEISFLTWKDAPKKLELYDFVERREMQGKQLQQMK